MKSRITISLKRALVPGILIAFTLSSWQIAWSQGVGDKTPRVDTSEQIRQSHLSAHSEAEHYYGSPAQRANDALIKTEVKAAISDENLADDYPVTVDVDHGRVRLTGVLASRADVSRALQLAQGIDGVTAVENRLTWQKRP